MHKRKGRGGKDTVVHKMPRYLLIYYRIYFILTSCYWLIRFTEWNSTTTELIRNIICTNEAISTKKSVMNVCVSRFTQYTNNLLHHCYFASIYIKMWPFPLYVHVTWNNFIIDQQLVRHFVQYRNVLQPHFPFMQLI